MVRPSIVVLALVVTACATTNPRLPGPGKARFANAPIAWAVDDRRDTPEPVAEPYYKNAWAFTALMVTSLTRPLSLPVKQSAMNINALDELPDSTWFTNRIGRRPMSPAEILRGPVSSSDPMNHKPWMVLSNQTGGAERGLVIRDSAGVKYILKFDRREIPEAATAAHMIVHRILWASGYHVPVDRIVHFRPSDLVVGKESKNLEGFGKARRLEYDDVLAVLRKVGRERGRPIRAIASQFVDGKVLGGYEDQGRRLDDRNDVVPHQHRRDLRGLQPLAAWLGHTDLKPGNTIDAWVHDKELDTRYVVHYLIDFGQALGNMSVTVRAAGSSFEHAFSWGGLFASLLTLGIIPRKWEGLTAPKLRGVGAYEGRRFSPGEFDPEFPFTPFNMMTAVDGFWGAKLVMRFTERQLRAAVDAGELSDPRARDYLLRTLIARQRKVGRYWFGRVSPVDRFAAAGTSAGVSLCFTDLMTHYRLHDDATLGTRFRAAAYDFEGRRLARRLEVIAQTPDQQCTQSVRTPLSHAGYTIFVIAAQRPDGQLLPAARVHVARDSDGAPRVIGVSRQRSLDDEH